MFDQINGYESTAATHTLTQTYVYRYKLQRKNLLGVKLK